MADGHPAIDEIDAKLLQALQANARASYAELAEVVGLSAPSVHARVKKLERQGVILGYQARIDPTALGLHISAFVAVTATNGDVWDTLEAGFRDMPEVEECHSVTGDDSYLLKVRVETPQRLEELLRQIVSIEGVARTRTVLVLSTMFDRRRLA